MATDKTYDQIIQDQLGPGDASAPAPAASYDELIQQDTSRQIRKSVMGAVQSNPDQEAKFKVLSERYKIPIESIRLDPAKVEQRAAFDSVDYDTLVKTSPVTSNLLADPKVASYAYDDYKQLSALEQIWVPVANTGKALYKGLSEGSSNTIYGGAAGVFGVAGRALDGPLQAVFGGNPLLGVEQGYLAEQKRVQQVNQRLGVPSQGFVGDIYSGVQSVGQMIPAVASMLAGNAGPAMGLIGAATGGQAYGQAREKGLDPFNAATFAGGQAAVEIATERIPVTRLLSDIKLGSPLHRVLMRQLAAEIPGEQVATVLQDLNEWAVLNPEKPFSAYLAERPSAAASTLVSTVTAVSIMGSAGHIAGRVANRGQQAQAQAEQAEAGAAQIQQINDIAKASNLLRRSPDTFEKFVEDATQDGPVPDVYIDANSLMQSGVAEQVAQISPSVQEQLASAAQTGGQIRIPVSEYATHIAPTEFAQSLLDHLKTDPEGMSRIEAQEYLQTAQEQLQQDLDRSLTEQQADDGFRESLDAVRDNIKSQLDTANRFTPQVNDAYATLQGSWYGHQASRLNITPQELYDRYPLQIQAQAIAADQQFNQEPVSVIRGTELGEDLTNDTVVGRAHEWFRNNLQGGTVEREGLGPVRISGKGWKKLKRGLTTDLDKARLIPAIPDIISSGEYLGRFPTDKARSDSIVAFHHFRAPVRLGNDLVMAGVSVAEDSRGNLFYNLNRNPQDLLDKRKAPRLPRLEARGAEPPTGTDSGTYEQSIPQQDSDINLDVGEVLNQPARGAFNPGTNTISLLKAADLSTFLHESGHFFLEAQLDMAAELSRIASETEQAAPSIGEQQIIDDANALLKWFGVSDLATWYHLDFEEKRSYHEQFARGFEAYLFEGNAPSLEIQGIFRRFSTWLKNIYRSLQNLNAELTPEVRSVMDRMLASDEQIRTAEYARSMLPLFESAEQAGMTPDEFASYQALGKEATEDAQAQLNERSLRDMKWLQGARSRALKRLQKEADAQRQRERIEARREIMSQPVYRAWQFLTARRDQVNADSTDPTAATTGRLSRPALRAEYGDADDAVWKALDKRRMVVNDGLPPDMVAELFDFTSGDELIQALAAAQPPDVEIEALTDLRMLERHGELATPDALARAADSAIHNEVRARAIAAEHAALVAAVGPREAAGTDSSGRQRTAAVLPRAAREFARTMVNRLKIRNLRPGQYTAAESRAAKAAEKAMRAGDLDQAAAEKRNQLVNNYAARETFSAIDEVESGVKYLNKFNNDGTRKNLDSDYLDQIDKILERFDLRPGQSLRDIDKRTSLSLWIEARSNEGTEPDLPPEIVAESFRDHYKNLSLEQFRGLVDSVKQIEHLGRLKHTLLTAKDKRELDAIVNEMRDTINENNHGRVVDNEKRNTISSTVTHAMRGFMAAHRKLANLVREMDGFKDGGSVWNYIVKPMNDAGNKEASMRAEATKKLYDLSKPILADGRMGGKGKFFPSINRSLNRGERLAIALNWGNDGNRQRLLDGRGWNEAQLQPVLATLSAKEWQFVQGVWDFFESYRPEIAAKERRVTGKEPDWVEPTPLSISTTSGDIVNLRGGYYPVKYDPNQSGEAGAHADAEQAKAMMRAAYTAATTRRSFTKSRADAVKGRPLLLTFDGIYQGANEVIHDLAWHEWLIDVNKLLHRLDGPIRTGYGAETVTAIKKTVEDIARGDQPAAHAVERGLNHLRTGSTVVGLGWNLTTALLQPLGITQSIARIGPVWVARGLREFFGNPTQIVAKANEVQEMSEFMRNRSRTMNREINEIQNRLTKSKSPMQTAVESSFFILIQKLQTLVDYPTWLGAYEKALADPANVNEDGTVNEERAIALADQAVIDSQGEGQTKDLSWVQRGHPASKLFTNFYSYFNTALNLAVDRTRGTNFKDPLQVARLAGDYLLIGVVPTMLGALLREALKGDGDDDDDLLKTLAAEQISFLTGLFVGVRELGGAAQMLAGVGNPAFGYTGPAGLRFFNEAYKFSVQVGQGDIDKALLKSTNNVAGMLFHYPAGQVSRAVEGTAALIGGRTTNPLAPLVGVPYTR